MSNPKEFPKNTTFIDELNDEMSGETQSEMEGSREGETRASSAEDFSKLLSESLSAPTKKPSVGDRIQAKILVLGRENIFVSTGTRFDGILPALELKDEKESAFKVGDVLELYVTQVRGNEIRLSRQKSGKAMAEDLEDAFDMMLSVQGRIVEVCNGGVRVNIKGKLAFCPISQIDTKRVENAEEYVGKSFEFRITQFSEGGRNIVVSRKVLLQEEGELNSTSFLEENQDGAIVGGRVTRLEKFGAFVELAPGVEGLVHISEIAGSRINDPSEVLSSGQEVQVKLLKREVVGGKQRIALSIKQANPISAAAPTAVASKYSVGQIVSGKVTRKELYGVFVQIEPGTTGLLHKSRIIDHPDVNFSNIRVGDSMTVQIAEIKPEDQRISLQMPRDPNEDDWRQHTQQVGSFGSLGGSLGDQLKASLLKKK